MSDHVRAREPDGPETIVGSDAGQVRAREGGVRKPQRGGIE